MAQDFAFSFYFIAPFASRTFFSHPAIATLAARGFSCAVSGTLLWSLAIMDSKLLPESVRDNENWLYFYLFLIYFHRINRYPADKCYQNKLRYPLDSDLSGG